MGMIGGGPGAFIGSVHRTAAAMDGLIELVAGAFSSDPNKSKQMGDELQLAPDRVYSTYEEMIHKEKALPAEQRIDFVSIVTPNHLHFQPAKLALQNGFDVVMDKPMTFDLNEAIELQKIVHQSGKYLCLTHTYSGYPMIKEARHLVQKGELGRLASFLEGTDQKQASWRTDPSKSGMAGAMGDIGTHAFNLVEYISGLRVTELCAHINIVVEGRKLDDDGAVFLRFNNGATGVLIASQVLSGEENNLTLKIYGEKGGLEWQHADPNSLLLKWPDAPMQVLRTGTDYLSAIAKHNTRTPSGHPEGFIEAFANHYRNFALSLAAKQNGLPPEPAWLDFPGVEEGVRGMAFIESVVASGKSAQKWTPFTI
jgi:predicted dehydrogenase